MAYVVANTKQENIANTGFTGVMANLLAYFEKRRIYSRTLGELQSLNDRELADLGLNRSIIRRVAWQAAYGN